MNLNFFVDSMFFLGRHLVILLQGNSLVVQEYRFWLIFRIFVLQPIKVPENEISR